jgi:serine/threonine protein kinase
MVDPLLVARELARLMALAPDRRAEALAAMDDAALRTELMVLLSKQAIAESTTELNVTRQAESALSVTSVDPSAPLLAHSSHGPSLGVHSAGLVGKRVGPYTLDAWIGDGGSASVYRAHRLLEGVRQTVAIKVLHRGLQALEARQQFDRERRVLSVLEHASIARWIDGGVSNDGVAYLVLEYVDGQSITSFARARRLSLRARIALMIEVANAVDAAHRALIVHRDLKPGNLMVNEAGQVKLLDFGIAKLLQADAENQTQVHMYTPAYAAPEQRVGGTITTATDVYAMGVILGELLTGKRFNSDITTTPSLQIDDEATEEGTLPAPPARLRQLIKGDLDNILLKALAQDPAKRYGSAAAFADDLRCALEGRPVAAHPPSPWYRIRKFVSRNRVSVALVGALSIAVLVASVVSVLFAISAERARARAELSFAASVQAVNDLTQDLAKNLREARGVRAETVADVLSKAKQLVDDIERTDPGNVALEHARIAMLLGFSNTYRSVARSELADKSLDEAWRRLSTLQSHGDEVPAAILIDALLARSEASYFSMQWQQSGADAQLALSLSRGEATRAWRARKQLASAYFFANELAQLKSLYSDDLLVAYGVTGLDANGVAHALDCFTTVASALATLGNHDEAEALRVRTRAETQQALLRYPNSSDLQLTTLRLNNLEANHLLRLELTEEALKITQQALAQAKEAIAANPNSAAFRLVAKSLYNIRAQVSRRRNQPELELLDLQAIRDLLKELSDRDLGNDFLRAELSFAERRLASTRLLEAKANPALMSESEAGTLAALQIDRTLLAKAPARPFARRYLAASLEQLGDLRRAQQRLDDAEVAYRESLQIRLALAHEFPKEAVWRRLLAYAHGKLKDLASARGDLIAAIGAQREAVVLWDLLVDETPDVSTVFEWFNSRLLLAELLLSEGQGTGAEARDLLAELTQYLEQHPEALTTRSDLIQELARLGKRASLKETH